MSDRRRSNAGRPCRNPGEKLSKNRTFRIRPSLDALLIAAAAKNGWSVGAEIERRLDRSFLADEVQMAVRAGCRQAIMDAKIYAEEIA